MTERRACDRTVLCDGDVAILVPPKEDPHALAAALSDLAVRHEFRDLAVAGRHEQRDHYSLPIMLDRYLDEYDRLLASGTEGPLWPSAKRSV